MPLERHATCGPSPEELRGVPHGSLKNACDVLVPCPTFDAKSTEVGEVPRYMQRGFCLTFWRRTSYSIYELREAKYLQVSRPPILQF